MSSWKTPDEIIRLQRLKQRTRALKARIDRPQSAVASKSADSQASAGAAKRKNPFADKQQSTPKRCKAEPPGAQMTTAAGLPESNSTDDSIFTLLSSNSTTNQPDAAASAAATKPPPIASQPAFLQSFRASDSSAVAAHLDDSQSDDEESSRAPTAHVPLDWSLKTKLRLLTLSRLTGNGLKSCQEASGITGFVRCLTPQTASDGLDISLGARFHQATMYWQHPHIPWLQLFPRNVRANAEFTFGDAERAALARDWSESFRALFQLLRARQCAYFYVCANTFNVLFCAAGVGGRDEQHAYLTPTSRGMRAALKQEEIEFTLPMKAPPVGAGGHNKSLDSGVESTTQSTSFSNCSEDVGEPEQQASGQARRSVGGADSSLTTAATASDADSDSDEDQDEWLASLGVEAAEIRKIGAVNARTVRQMECAEDFSEHSLALIEGIECQAFFNFLLQSKSTITRTGRLAGVPPTLLAPVAFPGATLRSVQTRASQIRMDGVEYHSLELKGVVLPHVLPYLCALMRESKDTFSASMTGHAATNAFSKAAQRLMEEHNKESGDAAAKRPTGDEVFGRENLSDCGLPAAIVEAMCRNSADAVRCLERMCFNKLIGGYTWN